MRDETPLLTRNEQCPPPRPSSAINVNQSRPLPELTRGRNGSILSVRLTVPLNSKITTLEMLFPAIHLGLSEETKPNTTKPEMQ